MTSTAKNVSDLPIDPQEFNEGLDLIRQGIAKLGLAALSADDLASLMRVSRDALPDYMTIADLAARRPDVIPNGLCDPAAMRQDYTNEALLNTAETIMSDALQLVRDNAWAARSDIARHGTAGYVCAARLADSDRDLAEAIKPLASRLKRPRR